jgi:CMP-N,N'-diacetyllegionaminic acid synthase|tara:strand:+ start:11235 stop:11906 length:672 start_codon:yes stop_codon:yes gene_type:complete
MRAGSQGVKNKNLKLINGKPLMYYTIKQAIKSKLFDKIIVTTDSKKIFKMARSHGAHGWFLRPKSMSLNTSEKSQAIRHALYKTEKFYNKKFDMIFDLDVTSPLRKTEDIKNAYNFFIRKNANILLSGCKSKKNPYFNMVEVKNGKLKRVKKLKKNIYRRQDAPATFDCNASIYIWKRKSLIKFKSFYTKKTVFYEMPESRSIDIDSDFDFKLVEFLLKEKKI